RRDRRPARLCAAVGQAEAAPDPQPVGPRGRPMTPPSAALPADVARRIEAACDRFEAAWRAGDPPRAEDFLAGWAEPGRTSLAHELVHLDVYYRRGRGEPCRPADYVARF